MFKPTLLKPLKPQVMKPKPSVSKASVPKPQVIKPQVMKPQVMKPSIPRQMKPSIPPKNATLVKEVLTGRNDYPVNVLKIMKRYGGEKIKSIMIKRTPVSRLLTKTLSTVSSEFGKRLKESNFDELFHLYLEVVVEPSGKKIYIEKNEVIAIHLSQGKKRPHEEMIKIASVPSDLTLDTMINRTKQSMGAKFFTYSANNNNCQDFLVAIMRSNKIGTSADLAFIKQDTGYLFKNLPYLRKFPNTLTTIGSRVDIVKNASVI